MGSLFSSSKEPKPTLPPYRPSSYYLGTTPVAGSPRTTLPNPSSQYNNAFTSYSRTPIGNTQTSPPQTTLYSSHFPKPSCQVTQRTWVVQNVVSNLPLMPSVYDEPETSEWDLNPLQVGNSYRLVNILESEDDFLMIKRSFNAGAKGKNFKVVKIERVENPFLLGCYLLKKEEMENKRYDVWEEMHFHGTKKCNANSICENNFNWRLYGDSTGSRYGQGVSFSPISYYASHYSDKTNADKIMFYAKVLVSNTILGNENMVLPPKLQSIGNTRYDTANKQDGSVIVKFCDNEFYPEFIIHYRTPRPVHHYLYVNHNIYDGN